MTESKYICERCSSDKIQELQWIYTNTYKDGKAEVVEMGEPVNVWCEECEDNTGIVKQFIGVDPATDTK
ncbi:MAG: hypothetical protein KAQ85_05690 [Thermodesulfovibrionia bacterium]|nr:hypothetical protein [Thermodesulfovibrionia bacterium]